MSRTLLVAFGGMLGSIARYWLAGVIQRLDGVEFPFGTLGVNVLGSFIVGVVMALSLERGTLPPNARIFLGESDRHGGRALYEVIVRTARELGLAGATVWRGVEGYGAASRIHTAKILRLSEDLPVIIEIVDSEEKIRAALPRLDALLEEAGCGGLITLERAEIIRYTHGAPQRPSPQKGS